MSLRPTKFRTWLMLLFAGIVLVAVVAVLGPKLVRAKAAAQKQNCRSNMAAIGLAGRMWSNDHGDHMPQTFTEMSNELASPTVLFCSANPEAAMLRHEMTSWTTFDERQCSYEIVNPGISEADPNNIFIRCKVHGHLGYVDGSIFDGTRRLSEYEAKFGTPRNKTGKP
jgi:hypothetical protein